MNSTAAMTQDKDPKKPDSEKFVIQGIKECGSKFRPSDWVDRIAALGAEYGADRRLRYSKELRTTTIDGQKCLLLDARLKETNESLYKMVICFAEENKLRITSKMAKKAEAQTCPIDGDKNKD